MKKLLSILLLFTVLITSAQKLTQERRIFYSTHTAEKGVEQAYNIVFINYGGEPTLKVYPNTGEAFYLDYITEFVEGVTKSGSKYDLVLCKKRETDFEIGIQIFRNKEYGIRFVTVDGMSFQIF